MRILHVYKDYYPVLGGIENHVRLLAEGQTRRGHQVTVLVTSPTRRESDEVISGVRVIKAARLATVASAPISLSLVVWMRRLLADITHLHAPYPIGELAWLVAGQTRRMVMTYHSDIVRQRALAFLYRPFLRVILRRADRILPTSPAYVASSPYLRDMAEKCTPIPLGIDVERFQQTDGRKIAAIRQQFGGPLVLFVGRLRYYKGLQYLIRAMTKVPQAQLLIIGSGPMGPSWQKLSEALGVDRRVHFLGDIPDEDLPAYIHASDIFVLPSSHRSEAYGVSMLEALACGVPAISTELGTGTSYVNRDGVTGLVVPPRDADALAAAMNRLLTDDELRQRLGMGARQWAEREFSYERMVERVLAIYEEVLALDAGG
jgi:rhamnosyl/mannosyltransferase